MYFTVHADHVYWPRYLAYCT